MATNFPADLDSYSTKGSGDTISEDHINNMQDAIEAIEAKLGVNSSAVDVSIDYRVNNFFVENTRKLWFYENTAPTGWQYESGITDRVIGIKGGSEAYSINGGNTAGDFDISIANMPAHTHTIGVKLSGSVGANGAPLSASASGDHNQPTNSTGGGDGKYRPDGAIGIIATYIGA